jgi:pimeloyl-ACP methyl ester carboxylesterase
MNKAHTKRLRLLGAVISLVAASAGACGNGDESDTATAPNSSAEVSIESSSTTSTTAEGEFESSSTTRTTPEPFPGTIAPDTVAPSTELPSTTVPRVTPAELPNSTLAGDVAFLGPIYTVPVGDLTMAYRQFGSGPDLLLIAGQASPMSVWPASLLAALAERARVTVFDNRDLGYTTATTTPFTLEELADDASGLIEALALDRPDVLGWSTGGEIGLLLAIRHPKSLSSLAVTGATPGGPQSVLPPPELIECFASDTPTCNLLATLFSDSPSGADATTRFATDYGKLGPQPPTIAGTGAKYDQAEQAYWSGDEPNFDAITVPVLVMNGGTDPAVPPSNAQYIAQRIGDNATLEIDPEGLHGWFFEHQDRFLALMTQFLSN